MGATISILGVLGGALLVQAGLVMIAPQVRIHQIRIYSQGSWVLRLGAVLTLTGVVLGGAPMLQKIALITGISVLMGGLITWNHERRQALDNGEPRWDFLHSLTLQMMGVGSLLTAVTWLI